jgi:hypothetical protein
MSDDFTTGPFRFRLRWASGFDWRSLYGTQDVGSQGRGEMSESMGQAQGVPAPQSVETTAAPQVARSPVSSMPELPLPAGAEPKADEPAAPVTRVGDPGQPPVTYGSQPAEADPVHDVAPPLRADFRPTVVDVPYAGQTGPTLNCTMGNWNGEPTSYAFQWLADGVLLLVGTAANYTIAFEDIGRTFACEVTASNAGGSTKVTSNDVVVVSPTG